MRNLLVLSMIAGFSSGCAGLWPASMEQRPAVRPLVLPRPPPEGAVQVGGVERLEDREDDTDLVNPHPRDPQTLAQVLGLWLERDLMVTPSLGGPAALPIDLIGVCVELGVAGIFLLSIRRAWQRPAVAG